MPTENPKMSGMVVEISSDQKDFWLENADGKYKFRVSAYNNANCPEQGQEYTVVYNIKPPDPQYADRGDTWWANEITSVGNGAAPMQPPPPVQPVAPHMPAQTPQGTYEKVRAAVAEPPAEKPPVQQELPQRSPDPNARDASIEWQVCMKEASANARANLEWAAKADENGERYPITSAAVVAEARTLFYGKEDPQHEEASQGEEVAWVDNQNFSEPAPPHTDQDGG